MDNPSNIDQIAQKIEAGLDLTNDELALALAHNAEEMEKRLMAEQEGK